MTWIPVIAAFSIIALMIYATIHAIFFDKHPINVDPPQEDSNPGVIECDTCINQNLPA